MAQLIASPDKFTEITLHHLHIQPATMPTRNTCSFVSDRLYGAIACQSDVT